MLFLSTLASFSSLVSASASRALKDESPDDDLCMTGDGAMCSMRSKKSTMICF